jgi:hypothetical protein
MIVITFCVFNILSLLCQWKMLSSWSVSHLSLRKCFNMITFFEISFCFLLYLFQLSTLCLPSQSLLNAIYQFIGNYIVVQDTLRTTVAITSFCIECPIVKCSLSVRMDLVSPSKSWHLQKTLSLLPTLSTKCFDNICLAL